MLKTVLKGNSFSGRGVSTPIHLIFRKLNLMTQPTKIELKMRVGFSLQTWISSALILLFWSEF